MYKKTIALSLLFLTSCGDHLEAYRDPFFTPYIERFQQDAANNNVELGDFQNITLIKFKDNLPNKNWMGECIPVKEYNDYYHDIPAHKEIYFSSTLKDRVEIKGYVYKVFLHEVGHCAYHLSHNSNLFSIMYETPIPPIDFSSELRQFFDDAKANQNNWFSYDPI